MTYREKENIVNIFSGLLITVIYGLNVYSRHLDGRINLTDDYSTWGVILLIFMLFSMVTRIIIYIVFHIINAIATKAEDIPKEDERDKLIKLMATRNSHWVFSGGFVISIIILAIGMPIYLVFIAFIISGLLTEIIDNASQLYYHRKGI